MIWDFVRNNAGFVVFGAITLIQVAPIKINPWSWLGKMLKKSLFGSIEEKIDKISVKVDRLEVQAEEDKAIQARTQILRFADELYIKVHHSQEYFLQMLDCVKLYQDYCKKHPDFPNGRTEHSCDLIVKTYDDLWAKHEF